MNKKDLKRKIYNDKRWQVVKTQVLIRDSYRCQHCGAVKRVIDVHHIIKIEYDPSQAFDSRNLISLCRSCHRGIENNKIQFFDGDGFLLSSIKVLKGKVNG